MKHRVAIMVAALWWGSLCTIGFVVVPMLFSHLGNPRIAGGMAAQLFTVQSYLGVVCGVVLLAVLKPDPDVAGESTAQAAIFLIVTGMLLALLLEFAIAPRIQTARASGGDLRLWHGLGSAMYLVQWFCASALLWRLSARSR
jgi:Domain of unknown function (DUF4149)